MKKIQVDKNGCKYTLFRIDIYFSKYFLAVEIDEKGPTDRNLIFEEKRQKALVSFIFSLVYLFILQSTPSSNF